MVHTLSKSNRWTQFRLFGILIFGEPGGGVWSAALLPFPGPFVALSSLFLRRPRPPRQGPGLGGGQPPIAATSLQFCSFSSPLTGGCSTHRSAPSAPDLMLHLLLPRRSGRGRGDTSPATGVRAPHRAKPRRHRSRMGRSPMLTPCPRRRLQRLGCASLLPRRSSRPSAVLCDLVSSCLTPR